MKLKKLRFDDRYSDWHLAPVEFLPELTLLVGISGVGKTQILRSITKLKSLAEGDEESRLWGTEWDVTFEIGSDYEWRWQGRFENKERVDGSPIDLVEDFYFSRFHTDRRPRPKIVFEEVSRPGHVLISRNSHEILLDGKPTVKLPPHDSVLHLLREEELVAPITAAFCSILSVNNTEEFSNVGFPVQYIEELKSRHRDVESIRHADLSTKLKLSLVHEVAPTVFKEISDAFCEIFPQVSDVRIAVVRMGYAEELSQLQIRERGVGTWIPEYKLSSGMSRTILHLARMALWPDGTVVLIDEFENSLGVNCINHVTENLVGHSRRLQFIITSHHPYIINNISVNSWKIVGRRGSNVSVISASELGLQNSSHEAFLLLMNSPAYEDGIEWQ